MPDFRITFKKSDGTKGVRVLSAPDGQSAGARVLREGHKVLRIEPIAVRVGAAGGSSGGRRRARREPGDGGVWCDFWRFRLLITPFFVRMLFLAITVSSIGAAVVLIGQFTSQRAEIERSLRPVKKQVGDIRSYIRDAKELEQERDAAEAKAARYKDDPEQARAYSDARRDVVRLTDMLQRAGAPFGVEDSSEAGLVEDALVEQIQAKRSEGPSFWLLIGMVLLIPLWWLWIRIMLEFLVVIFSIHDRLLEMGSV